MMNKLHNPRLSTNRSVILHFYSLDYRCTVRHTKFQVRTVRYNTMKIRQQGNTEYCGDNDRSRKIPANINFSLGQWIRKNYCKINSAETRATSLI